MANGKTISLTVTRRFSSSPERVFDAWLDPDMARRWLFTTAESEVARCEMDPRVGGSFTIVDRREDGDIEHVGTYLVIDRPKLLVFNFAVPKFSPLYDKVTVELRPLDGGCELSLTNELDIENEEWREQTIEGWTMILNSLARELGEDTVNQPEHDDAA
jgi:uncharacterized protein YndB with AHSA1/START domain